MSYREKTNRSLKKVLLMRGCCKSEVLPKEVLLYTLLLLFDGTLSCVQVEDKQKYWEFFIADIGLKCRKCNNCFLNFYKEYGYNYQNFHSTS